MDYELEKQLNDLNYLIAKLNSSSKSFADNLQFAEDTRRNHNSSVSNNTAAQNNNASGTTRYQQIVSQEEQKNDKFKENLTNAFGHSINMLTSLGGALVSGQAGLQKYTQTVESLGKGASDLGQNFGLAGMASFGLVGLLTKFASSILNLNQNTLDIRNNFVKAGGIMPVTTTRLGELAKQAGFALDSMKVLTDKMTSLSTAMTSLGGTAGEGAVKFMQIANVEDRIRREFGRLGVSQDDLLNLQGLYLEMQQVSGNRMQNETKSASQMQRESLQYAKTLITLSSITGKNAEELQKEINSIMLEVEEQNQIMTENAQIARLKSEGRHAEAAELQRQADNRKKMITVYSAIYGRDIAMQAARVARTGAIDSKTREIAMLPIEDGIVKSTQRIINSENAAATLASEADRMDEAIRTQNTTFRDVIQQDPESARNIGIFTDALVSVNSRTEPVSQMVNRAIADMDAKTDNTEADPLANNIESVREFERDTKKLFQTLLEFIDPMRNNNWVKVLTGALALAGAALTALAVVKIGRGLVGGLFELGSTMFNPVYIRPSGGSLTGLGSAAFAGSAADPTGLGLRKADLVDKNGRTLQGAALDARLKKLSNERLPKTTSFALKQAAKNSAKILKGAATLAGSITIIGAGAAAAIAAIGLALPTFAEGMKKFNEVDGDNLKGVGIGLGGLGVGIVALAAEKIVGFFNLIGSAMGAESPLERAVSTLKDFEKIDVDPDKIERNGKATLAFAKAFEEMPSTTISMSGLLAGFFSGPEIPYAEFEKFAAFEIDVAKTENNSKAFIAFSNAMATYSGFGAIDGLGAVTTALADSVVRFYEVDPPEKRFKEFSDLKIDAEQAGKNAAAFKNFSEAMSRYRGPPGILASISSLIGTQINRIFGASGPVEAFIKFSQDTKDIGSGAAKNARAFFNFARALGMLTGGTSNSGGIVSTIAGWFGGDSDSSSGDSTGGGEAPSTTVPGNYFKGDAGTQTGNTVRIGNELRTGGTVSWRTNNSGNVSYVGLAVQYGAVGRWKNPTGDAQQRSTGIAIMPTYEHGINLKMAQWRRPMYQPLTIHQGVSQWVTGKANPIAPHVLGYASDMARAAGASLNTPLPRLSNAQLRAMVVKQEKWEGFRAGTVRQAKVGGLFTGPTSGYPMELHGTELIVPVNSNSILMKLATQAETTAEDVISTLTQAQNTNSGVNNNSGRAPAIDVKRIESLSRMFDQIIDVIDSTDDIDKKILQYA
jgi:hypothetical protein